MNKLNLLSQWINCLLKDDNLPFHLFSNHDICEDGMNIEQYWTYEKNLFKQLAPLYDLDEDFSITIIAENALTNNKFSVCFYLINKYKKIVYKMTQTLLQINKDDYLLTGNDFLCQIVPKYKIVDYKIVGYGLAIQSPYVVENILSPDIFLENLNIGANFQEDGFYSAQFLSDEILQNSWFSFYIVLQKENKHYKEKRKIYFDNFLPNLNPVKIDQDNIIIIDSNYPVNLCAYKNDNSSKNYSYPRKLSLDKSLYNKIVATDCLDNDWFYIIS